MSKRVPSEVFVVYSTFRFPNMKGEPTSESNICFLTSDEAERYCRFHNSEMLFYRWHSIIVGKFPERKKARKS